jgi:hypothetical protein
VAATDPETPPPHPQPSGDGVCIEFVWSASGALSAMPSTFSNSRRDIVYANAARTITVSVSASKSASLRKYARSC